MTSFESVIEAHRVQGCPDCRLRQGVHSVAKILLCDIQRLERPVLILMSEHSTLKASGPAHTAAHLDRLARELFGPTWQAWAAGGKPVCQACRENWGPA